MQDTVFSLASFLIAAVAFGLGAARLFKKKKPLYFQLLVCAAGCFALQMLSYAVLENAFILGGAADSVSVTNALIRGFGAGMMHGVCTLAVGFGMSFVHTRRKLFYTGTTALLAAAVIYHSVYNTLVQSVHPSVGFLLPLVTFIPALVLLNRTAKE